MSSLYRFVRRFVLAQAYLSDFLQMATTMNVNNKNSNPGQIEACHNSIFLLSETCCIYLSQNLKKNFDKKLEKSVWRVDIDYLVAHEMFLAFDYNIPFTIQRQAQVDPEI